MSGIVHWLQNRARLIRKESAPQGDYGSKTSAGYADPGYQPDEKPRYPLKENGHLDAKHIRSAWDYIAVPKNQQPYTSKEVEQIKGRIISAWKEEIDPAGPPSAVAKGMPNSSQVHVDAPLGAGDLRAPALDNLQAYTEQAKSMLKGDLVGSDEPELPGLNLDLGSGAARRPGYVGMDVFRHDPRTFVQDLNLGLPFSDGSVHSVNAVNSLHEVDNTKRLLADIVRTLEPGGTFHYEGPQPLTGMPAGITQLQSNTLNAEDGDWTSQDFQKDLGQDVTKCAVFKADSDQHLVYGVVLTPNEKDTQGDVISPEEIQKAAHGYLVNSRAVGAGHERLINANVVESYIAPQDLESTDPVYGPQTVKKGAWVLGVKVNDPKEWDNVKAGKYTAFSVGGVGARS